MSYERPYENIRVVDLTQGIAGPYCAMLLAQYGAEVVKVEPLDGDWARILGRRYGDHTAFSIAGNLGKRSVALDIKSERGKEAVRRLLVDADVFMEGFRPGVIDRLGFGYVDVQRVNPDILYVSISGFGQTGPLSTKPAMDPVLQAFTGFMMQNKGFDGVPHRAGPIVIDMSTALYTHQAIAAALYARRDEPHGRYIDASLMQAAANLQVVRMMATWLEGGEMAAGTAPSGVFRTADGWLQLVVLRDQEFQRFCRILGTEDWLGDERYADGQRRIENADELNEQVQAILLTRAAREWSAILTEAGLQNEVVQDYSEFLRHPQVEATGLVSWLKQPGLDFEVPVPNPPGTPRLGTDLRLATSPHLGEHGREVMCELGFGPDEIESMLASGELKLPG